MVGILEGVGDGGTLGDGAGTGTLGYGAVCTDTLGGAVGIGAGLASRVDGRTAVACWLAWSNMQANFWIAWSWASPIWAKGAFLGLDGGIIRGTFRYRTILGGKFNCLDDAVCSGIWYVYLVAPIVFGGAADAPSGDAMGCLGAANSGGFKNEDFCAGRSEGRAIEFEGSLELGFI